MLVLVAERLDLVLRGARAAGGALTDLENLVDEVHPLDHLVKVRRRHSTPPAAKLEPPIYLRRPLLSTTQLDEVPPLKHLANSGLPAYSYIHLYTRLTPLLKSRERQMLSGGGMSRHISIHISIHMPKHMPRAEEQAIVEVQPS